MTSCNYIAEKGMKTAAGEFQQHSYIMQQQRKMSNCTVFKLTVLLYLNFIEWMKESEGNKFDRDGNVESRIVFMEAEVPPLVLLYWLDSHFSSGLSLFCPFREVDIRAAVNCQHTTDLKLKVD
ncbi:hypothetical protein Nepgr_029502 [Nepenthes gracilis]|uniref:Uncharacterized protein n=1 Tax=Nepenthes gracilis TaxID=150966 RepID=A0AAD3Y551_NEPGR|nr:hypothetical protein Nepgr_029502 [Nepenthes gracilis]